MEKHVRRLFFLKRVEFFREEILGTHKHLQFLSKSLEVTHQLMKIRLLTKLNSMYKSPKSPLDDLVGFIIKKQVIYKRHQY